MWIDEQSDTVLDPQDSSPLHQQLSEVVRSAIVGGELPPGTRLPTEAQFQERFGISRSVVRQALSSLTNLSLIQRGRGRGTVVAPQHEHHRAVQKMSGLSAQIAGSDGPVATEVLHLERASDPRAEKALGTSDLLSLLRRRSVGGETIALIHTWLACDAVPGLTANDLADASLHNTLATRYGTPVSAGRRQVRAVSAAGSVASQLSVQPGTPLLVLEGTSLDDSGKAVEYFCTWHRGDRVVFDVDAGADRRRVHCGSPSQTPADTDLPGDVGELAERASQLAAALDDFAMRTTQLPRD